MARPEKVAVVDEVRSRLDDATATVLTEYRGLTVTELAELRANLRVTSAEYKVVKNTLTKRAVADAGLDVPDAMLVGPTAITFCAGDPVATAKVLRAFAKDHPSLVVKGGILDGRLLDATETMKLADLASREETLATIAGMLGTLLAAPARLAKANLDKVARVLGALEAKRAEDDRPADAPQDDQPAGDP